MEPNPAWFHSSISKEGSEELMQRAGSVERSFLMRKREGTEDFVLTVYFKGKVSHHLITRENGILLLNKKNFKNPKNLMELAQNLKSPVEGWPVLLEKGVDAKGVLVDIAATAKIVEATPNLPPRSSTINSTFIPFEKHKFFHPNTTKEKADKLLSENSPEDGVFLFRFRIEGDTNEIIISVIFKGKPTHHLLKREEGTDMFKLNGVETNCSSVDQIISFLSKKHSFWPVPLIRGVPKSSEDTLTHSSHTAGPDPSLPISQKSSEERPPTIMPKTDVLSQTHEHSSKPVIPHVEIQKVSSEPEPQISQSVVSIKLPDNSHSSQNEHSSHPVINDSIHHDYFHGLISKEKAEELLSSQGLDEGRFLLRLKAAGNMDEIILSVVYKGKPTHHLMKRDGPGKTYFINGKPTDAYSIQGVIDFLKTKQSWWPVPLTQGVLNTDPKIKAVSMPSEVPSTTRNDLPPTSHSAPLSVSPAPPVQSKKSYFHSTMSKDDAEKALSKIGLTDGVFLFRQRVADNLNEFVLSVVYKGKPTHHLLKREQNGSVFFVNNKPTGSSKTLGEVAKFLAQPQTFWPVPLTIGVESTINDPTESSEKTNFPIAVDKSTEETKTRSESVVSNHTINHPKQHEDVVVKKFTIRDSTTPTDGGYMEVTPILESEQTTLLNSDKDKSSMRDKAPPHPSRHNFEEIKERYLKPPTKEECADLLSKGLLIVQKWETEALDNDQDESDPEGSASEDDDDNGEKSIDSQYFHGFISQESAVDKINEAGAFDGMFLVYSCSMNNYNQFYLSVVFQDKITHHIISRRAVGDPFLINGASTNGSLSLSDVVSFLRKSHSFWPVPLRDGVIGEYMREKAIRKKAKSMARAELNRERKMKTNVKKQNQKEQFQQRNERIRLQNAMRNISLARKPLPPKGTPSLEISSLKLLAQEIDMLQTRLMIAMERDKRLLEIEAEKRAKAEELLKPVKFRRTSIIPTSSQNTSTQQVITSPTREEKVSNSVATAASPPHSIHQKKEPEPQPSNSEPFIKSSSNINGNKPGLNTVPTTSKPQQSTDLADRMDRLSQAQQVKAPPSSNRANQFKSEILQTRGAVFSS